MSDTQVYEPQIRALFGIASYFYEGVVLKSTTQCLSQALLTVKGEVFTWGCGEGFALGTATEDSILVPTRVLSPTQFSQNVSIKRF